MLEPKLLTRKQHKYYALWVFGGLVQREIAAMFDTTQPRVSEVICRARKRNPNLPPPPHYGRRRRESLAA